MAFTQLEVARALATTDMPSLITTLRGIAAAGEGVAAEMGYADYVAKFVGHQDPEVRAAAIDALGGMGSIGAAYAGTVADQLTHTSCAVRVAACQALGNFGADAENFTFRLSSLVAEDLEARVQAAAIPVLAGLGSNVEVIKTALESDHAEVAGAACEALGALGELSQESVTEKLASAPTSLSALRALSAMGQKAYVSCLDEVVARGLKNQDAAFRAEAITIIGNLAEAAVLDPTCGEIKECVTSPITGVRAAAALAFAAMGETAAAHVGVLDALLIDADEDTSGLSLVIGTGARRAPAHCRKPKCAALFAIGRMRALSSLSPNSLALLKSSFNDTDWEVRLCLLEMLACFRKARHFRSAVANLLDDKAFPVRAKAIACLGNWSSGENCGDIVNALKDTAPDVREAAATALSMLGEVAHDYSHEVYKLFNDKSAAVRCTAIKCLASMGDLGQNYAPVIATMMNEDDVGVRVAAIEALGGMGVNGAAFLEDIGDHLYLGAAAERSAAQMAMAKLGFVPAEAVQAAPTHVSDDKPAHYATFLAAERAKMGLKH